MVENGALILDCANQTTITIGDSIRVTVASISSGSVRLAIEAPADVYIVRSEIPNHTYRTR